MDKRSQASFLRCRRQGNKIDGLQVFFNVFTETAARDNDIARTDEISQKPDHPALVDVC